MLALLATLLLAATAPPDTSLDGVMGRWDTAVETTTAFPIDGEAEPDTVTIRTVAAALEIRPDTLVWTAVSAVFPPHGDGRLPDQRERAAYRADGLTLCLANTTVRPHLDGEYLVTTPVGESAAPPLRYRRAAPLTIPEAPVGLWGTTASDDAGVGLDAFIRIQAEGTMQILRDDPVPILALGPYLLRVDPQAHFYGEEAGIEREALLLTHVEVEGDRLTWAQENSETLSLVRVRERAPRRSQGEDAK